MCNEKKPLKDSDPKNPPTENNFPNSPSPEPEPQEPPDPDSSQTTSQSRTTLPSNKMIHIRVKPTPRFVMRVIKTPASKRPLEGVTDSNPKMPKQPEPQTPAQSSSQTHHTPGTTTETQTKQVNNSPKPPLTFLHPSSYNNALGYLMSERIKTILGPEKEPITFEDESESSGSEDDFGADEDVYVIADRSCQVCFKKPPNITLERHRRLGGFATNHKLGMLSNKKKDALAIITLSATVQNGILTCRHCNDFQINLREETKLSRQNINHLMTHGSLLGENPSALEVLHKQRQGPLLCLECTEVFPTFLSLMVHCGFTRDHSEKREIFCNLCHRFFDNTTLISHHLQHHNNTLKCPQCELGFVTIMDLLIHLLNSKPHYQLSPEVQNMFTHKQLQEVTRRRQPNTIATTRTQLMIRDTLKTYKLHHLARYINQPELFNNFQAEIQDEPFKMPNIVELVAKYLSKDDSLAVSDILRVLRFGVKLAEKTQDYEKFKYEVTQINIGIFLKDLYNNATVLPAKIDDLLYGTGTYTGPHLLGQSYLAQTTGKITAVDSKSYRAIVIGLTLLDKSGTLPNSPFPTLNLSPDFPQEQKWPTHFYTNFPDCIQGIIHLEGKALHHLPEDRNYLQHIKQMTMKAPLNIPIFIEMNLYPFLICHAPETWANLLQRSLKSILLGFFAGLTKISQEVHEQRGTYPEYVIVGQPPIPGNHQISSTLLLELWYQINVATLLIARFTKTIFIPSTGVIGFAPKWFTNILDKPNPTFNTDQSVSNYTRVQALQILQYYVRAKKQTEDTLSN